MFERRQEEEEAGRDASSVARREYWNKKPSRTTREKREREDLSTCRNEEQLPIL